MRDERREVHRSHTREDAPKRGKQNKYRHATFTASLPVGSPVQVNVVDSLRSGQADVHDIVNNEHRSADPKEKEGK